MATSEKMKTYPGRYLGTARPVASGPDFDITFGLAHTIEKSAEIYVKVLSMGGGLIRQTITDDDLAPSPRLRCHPHEELPSTNIRANALTVRSGAILLYEKGFPIGGSCHRGD